jgi:dTDP-4-dehydrorhamnose reductase
MSEFAGTLVFGASGQLGRAFGEHLGERAALVDQEDADFSRPEELPALLDRIGPGLVINAAAYTAVDRAEDEPEKARTINAIAPGALARWCAGHDVPLVHFSTDYVFSGDGTEPWREEDETGPLNTYGRTKLEGEEQIGATGARALIFRTSWLYDASGANFLTTMLRMGRDREEIGVVADQFGSPTYAPHLASAVLDAVGKALSMPSFPAGTYHLCNAGATSWHGFAEQIFAEARARGIALRVRHLRMIPSSEYPAPARRPANSRLDTGRAARAFGIALPHWRDGLAECMERYEVH